MSKSIKYVLLQCIYVNTISEKMHNLNIKLIIEAWFKFCYIIDLKDLLFVSQMWCRCSYLPVNCMTRAFQPGFLTNVQQLHFSCHYQNYGISTLLLQCVLFLLYRIHCKNKFPCKLYLLCVLFYLLKETKILISQFSLKFDLVIVL